MAVLPVHIDRIRTAKNPRSRKLATYLLGEIHSLEIRTCLGQTHKLPDPYSAGWAAKLERAGRFPDTTSMIRPMTSMEYEYLEEWEKRIGKKGPPYFSKSIAL